MFNVKRNSTPEPPSLSQNKSYNGDDVLKALSEIFYDKCYICERKRPDDINVEHFIAHEGKEELKYKWSNLFLACSRCNNIKNRFYNNILDCTDSNVDVCRSIKLLPPYTPSAKKIIVKAMIQGDKTTETCSLLEKVYNSEHTVNKSITGAYLRQKVFTRLNKFFEYVNTYLDPEDLTTSKEKDVARDKIENLLQESQEFSAFLRWVVLEDSVLEKEFSGLF